MQEAFEKLKGVDIFALKSYLEKTSKIETSIIVAMNEIFVNLFFFVLNLVVGFFSLMIRVLENIDLYDSYKCGQFHLARANRLHFGRTFQWFISFYASYSWSLLPLLSIFLFTWKLHAESSTSFYRHCPWIWILWNSSFNFRGSLYLRYN